MCLEIITEREGDLIDATNKPFPTEGEGFKVFQVRDGLLFGDYMAVDHERPRGVWLNASDFQYGNDDQIQVIPQRDRPEPVEPELYRAGWHIFIMRESAEKWRCDVHSDRTIKVRYRGAHTQGWQEDCSVVVADEIYILTEEEEKNEAERF